MSAIVSFSDGGSWTVGQRGWNRILERTCDKLREIGQERLTREIYDYGVAFDLQSDLVRIPLARAVLDAASELQVELAGKDNWEVDRRGPYFGELVARLERELDT